MLDPADSRCEDRGTGGLPPGNIERAPPMAVAPLGLSVLAANGCDLSHYAPMTLVGAVTLFAGSLTWLRSKLISKTTLPSLALATMATLIG